MKQFKFFSLFIFTVIQSSFGQYLDNSGSSENRDVFGPMSLTAIAPKFKLYTNQNLNDSIDFTLDFGADQLKNSPFDRRIATMFIIHGFKNGYNENEWTGKLKNAILDYKPNKYNIFGLDWRKGADLPLWKYPKAVANVPVVGSALADFIIRLVNFTNINCSNVHLTGHSLGAHIAGHAGRRFQNPKIGRITGLDAAGPRFRKPEERLGPSDALYVENIHTDASESWTTGFGLKEPIAMIDFYPNGGYEADRCNAENAERVGMTHSFAAGASEVITCDHQYAHRLVRIMPRNLPENCQFVGIACQNYSLFLQGFCNCENKCAILSLTGSIDPETRFYYKTQVPNAIAGEKYYFKTSAAPPYCMYHYQVRFHFYFATEFNGDIIVKLHSHEHIIEFTLASKRMTYLITVEKALGHISHAVLRSSDPNLYLPVEFLEVSFLSNISPKVREEFSSVLLVDNSAKNESQLNAYPIGEFTAWIEGKIVLLPERRRNVPDDTRVSG